MSWDNKDLNLIHTSHVLQIVTGKQGSQHTLLFHVDDLKSSHKNPKVNVNDEFEEWLQTNYGQHRKVVSHLSLS
jgi:hypothetical protein